MKKVSGVFFLVFCLSMVAIPLCCFAGPSMKLHMACWNVPKDPNSKVLEAIGKDIETATEGDITFEISYQGFGKPGDYYDALVNGLCDVAYFGPTYSPGRFLMTEMMTLPIYYPNNKVTVMAYYELWKRGFLDKEFAKIIPVAFGNNSQFLFMWKDVSVTKLDQLKGKKVSAPYSIHSEMVKRAGATPVSMPVTEVYMALDTGVIEGAWQIWPAMPIFKMYEVVKYATDVSMSCGPYVIAFNEKSYKKLPEKVKKLLQDSQEKYSMMMASGFQKMTDIGKELFLKAGGKIQDISPEETAKLQELWKPIFSEWIGKAKKRGLPAEKSLDELYKILTEMGVKKPFVR